LAVSPNRKWVVTGSDDWMIHFWDSTSGKPISDMDLPHKGPPALVAFSPDGSLLVTTTWGRNEALLWELVPGNRRPVQRAVLAHRAPFGKIGYHRVGKIAFNCDGTRVATASDDGTAWVWDTASGRAVFDSKLRHDGAVMAIAFSPDGRKVLTGGADGVACCWNVATGDPLGPRLQHDKAVWEVVFNPPDGRMILTASEDMTAQRWDADTGAPLGPPLRHDQAVLGAAFSPDGQTVLTRSGNTARLWDAATGQRRGVPLRHAGPIKAVAFRPNNGRWIVTGSADGTARVWDASTGRPLSPPVYHGEAAHFVAVDPRSEWFVTAGPDGTAKLWLAPFSLKASLTQIVLGAQVRTGAELDPDGSVKVLDIADWRQLRQCLENEGGYSLP
jgi:WD40 repeat protein